MNFPSFDLNSAAFAGDLDKVRALIKDGADPNSADANGLGTLLTFHPPVIAFLMENGADPDIQTNEFGASVLAGLCYVNQTECVRVLLEKGADVNLGRKESQETPLHHAMVNGVDHKLVELLVQSGANVNAKAKAGVYSYNYNGDTPTRGETPLHRAAAYATIETVKLLLDSGGDRTIPDANGNTPFQWAGWHQRANDLVQLLAPKAPD